MEQSLIFLILIATSFLFADIPLIISMLLRPKIKDKRENIPYESGEIPKLEARNLTFGYYEYCLIYLIFEISAILLIFLAILKNLISLTIFSLILMISLIYFYKNKINDSNW